MVKVIAKLGLIWGSGYTANFLKIDTIYPMKRMLILILTCLIVFSALISVVLLSKEGKVENVSKDTSSDVSILALETVKCKTDTDCMKGIFSVITEKVGIEKALELLQREIKSHPKLGRFCHDIAHEVGTKGYTAKGDIDFMLSQGNGICTGGFYHGILNSWFNETGLSEEKLKKSVDLCQLLSASPGLVESCVHGALHTLYGFNDKDYTESFKFCTGIDTIWQGSCAWAIGMEYQKNSEFEKVRDVKALFDMCEYFRGSKDWSLCTSQLSRGFIKIFKSGEYLVNDPVWVDFMERCNKDIRCIDGAARELTTIYEYEAVIPICVNNFQGEIQSECIISSLWWSANLTRETDTWLTRCESVLSQKGIREGMCKEALEFTVERRVNIEGGEF